MKKIVILGGAFFALGNVNPAAEANVQHSLLEAFIKKLKWWFYFFVGLLLCNADIW